MKNLITFILIAITTTLESFLFYKLWSWIIVPIFDYRPLSVLESLGLIIIINYIKTPDESKYDNELTFSENITNNLPDFFYRFMFFLAVGKLISLFI